jgi:hypothetical protein
MADPTKSQEIVRWAPAHSPVTIEYTLGLMAQIRDHVIVGFHRLAKRGIECGGILYGKRDGTRLIIEQIREIRCEYKLGPTFVLSDADRLRLTQQLSDTSDPDLAGLAPLGLYISHTKDDLRAAERDLTLFDSYFREDWQVLLILRPARQGSVRAGFFVREADGRLNGDQSYEEFELDPPDSPAEAAALMAAARAGADAQQQQAFPTSSRSGGAAAAPAMARVTFTPDFGGAQGNDHVVPQFDPGRALVYPGGSRHGRGLSPAVQVAETVESLRQRFPSQGQQQANAPRQKHWSWLFAWLVGIAALVGTAYFLLAMRSPEPLLLRVAAQSGDLRIEWDRASTSIQRSSGGTLEIRDAVGSRELRLSPEQLSTGTYLFPIGGGDVSIRLSVDGLLIPRVEESVNFVAQAKPGLDPARLSQENRGLRDDLRRQREANEKLEQRLRALEERMQTNPTPTTTTRTRRKKAAPAPDPE